MITKELIEELVGEEYNKNFSKIDDVEAYMITIGVEKQGLRQLFFYSSKILAWIKQVVESDKKFATSDIKVQVIQEIFKNVDKGDL